MADGIVTRGPQLAAVDYTFAVLAFVTISMRCGVRVFIVRSFGLDDWLMLLAAGFFILYCSFSITGVSYGTGRHEYELPQPDVATARMFWWLCYLMYCMTMILSKVSIGCLLLRVAAKKMHTWIIYGAMVITVVTCMAFFLVTVCQCQPVSFFWNKAQHGSCVSNEVIIGLAYLYSSCSVITDFTFALLPAWIIVGLQLKRRTKIALIPLMAMGCVASGAVVVRFAYLPRFRDPDFLWATVDIAIWSTVEQGLAVAAGSLATLRPLIKLVGWKLGLTTGPSAFGTSSYGKMGTYGNSQTGTGQLSSRRRGSQGAVDALRLDTLQEENGRKTPALSRYQGAYEVSCHTGTRNSSARMMDFPDAISHGKTYEVSSEYIGSPTAAAREQKELPRPPTDPKSPQWREKGRLDSSDSIEVLRSAPSRDTIDGNGQTFPRSFLTTDSDSSR
ncbi:hypothetical protein JX265_002024 [Neoarthrinium moseri]|uniref:Rhodopsin domain-containing protein n=1 Tax=Neoarthrinium moseri TaxID=1658444 RepID=A0A9P9WWC2_9PEZI|nr:uncharacterized protein JN550_005772 [Neoarthrinium moseri]KAI1848019.1 hypothetical protein JX266_006132 [Neoarthrinium moseri]KAI1869791.1 hypothetical protein JN550_005772 [Neoarthrinium moseri]KAI1880403.1 hypothetical protein JX265_002024 [Neoarthrinium moseri]